MRRLTGIVLFSFVALFVLSSAANPFKQKPRELTWLDLLPDDGQSSFTRAGVVHELLSLYDVLDENFGSDSTTSMAQQSPAAPIVKELNGQFVKLPGYIVPLQIDKRGQISEFLLVPYFGACIHVPPPPSNQIVFVKNKQRLNIGKNNLYEPYWIEGVIRTEIASSELADAGYTMQSRRLYLYTAD